MKRDTALKTVRDIADGLLHSGDTRVEVSHALHEAANVLEQASEDYNPALEAYEEYVTSNDEPD
jgi:hypothetical protein